MKISILVITYNHEKYIRKALESIFMQKECGEFEIILCDDHSTDNTIAIATEMLSDKGNADIFVNEKNLGITKNYQQAFVKCKGEYIFILEGDDYWISPYKLKKQSKFLDEHSKCAMCAHPFIIQQADDSIIAIPESSVEDFIYFEGKDLILDESIVSNFSTCCYRRNMLEKISEETYETISYEWMINISISEFGLLARINEPMSVYRHLATGSWTKLSMKERLEGMYNILSVYDRILGYRYTIYFKQKQQMLQEQLKNMRAQERHYKGFTSFLNSLVKRKKPAN